MNLTRSQLIIFVTLVAVIIFFVLVFLGVIPGLQRQGPPPVKATLRFWDFGHPQAAYFTAIQNFNARYPAVKVEYTTFDSQQSYEDALLDALAAGNGPDVFMVHNNAVLKYSNKISPLSPQQFSLLQARNLFPQVVEQDFYLNNAFHGLPLSIDTLALYYNRDMFDEAAVVPPQYWEDVEALVPTFTQKESDGTIIRGAIALGLSDDSVRHAPHILSLFMMQKDTPMSDPVYRLTTFNTPQGIEATRFYTQFADPQSKAYTWNRSLHDSLDAFAQEKVAMILDYASAYKSIKTRNSFLDFAIVPSPQFKNSPRVVSYPSYWGYTVARRSPIAGIAWDFVLSLTTNQVSAKGYLSYTNEPPALRSFIQQYINHLDFGAYARQALTATSWLQNDPLRVDQIFSETIDLITSGKLSIQDALEQAEGRLNQARR